MIVENNEPNNIYKAARRMFENICLNFKPMQLLSLANTIENAIMQMDQNAHTYDILSIVVDLLKTHYIRFQTNKALFA